MIHNLILNLTVEQSSVMMQILSDFIESQNDDYSKADVTDALGIMSQITNSLNAATHIENEKLP